MDTEKNEYGFLTTALVFGLNSPLIDRYSAYRMPSLCKYPELRVTEYSGVGELNRLDVIRTIRVSEHRELVTSHTAPSGIATAVTYHDWANDFVCADAIFTDKQFENLEMGWSELLERKINHLSVFLRALHLGNIRPLPIFIHEFPNIFKHLVDKPDYWVKE